MGNTPLRGSGASGRSSRAYPVLLAGSFNRVTFLAETGATTVDVLMEQVPMVPEGARQITLTVGGNDVGFAQIALTCATNPDDCAAAVGSAGPALDQLRVSLPPLIDAVQDRAPRAKVYVTGYPELFQPTLTAEGYVCPALPQISAAALAAADTAVTQLNAVIAGAAASQDAVYVDVAGEFEGSGLCTAPGSLIYPPTLDSAGFAPSSLHPTALGQQVYADAIDGAGFVTG